MVAQYIGLSLLSKQMSVSPLKLQKLLYYMQSWYMVFFGRENTLFEDVPHAWVNGPVYPEIYRKYKNCVSDMCQHLNASHFGVDGDLLEGFKDVSMKMKLSKDELELIESIILLYGAKSQNKLILLTHSELPWVEKREGLAPYEKSDVEMSLDTMFSYYMERHERNRGKA